jgi:lipase maturation factor 1
VSGTRFWLGLDSEIRPSRPELASVRTFLRLLGLVYFVAFLSFGVQAQGLIGARGILPFGDLFEGRAGRTGRRGVLERTDTAVAHPTDTAMKALWLTGCLWALIAVFGRWQRPAMAVCLVLWLSLCSVGQDFYSFQWDILLSEAGFLAIFADAARVRIWLFRWLLFRLMFFSGAVKLLSAIAAWRDFTALTYHYYTQPLPTPLAWYMQQLPGWFQKASVGFRVSGGVTGAVPVFRAAALRHVAAWLTIALQVLILLTGNYTFFNFLTIALCMWLFIEPDPG